MLLKWPLERVHEAVCNGELWLVPREVLTEDYLIRRVGRYSLMSLICQYGQAQHLPKSAFTVGALTDGGHSPLAVRHGWKTPLHRLSKSKELRLIPSDIPRHKDGSHITRYLLQMDRAGVMPFSLFIPEEWWRAQIYTGADRASAITYFKKFWEAKSVANRPFPQSTVDMTYLQFCAARDLLDKIPDRIIEDAWDATNDEGQNFLLFTCMALDCGWYSFPDSAEWLTRLPYEAFTMTILTAEDKRGNSPIYYIAKVLKYRMPESDYAKKLVSSIPFDRISDLHLLVHHLAPVYAACIYSTLLHHTPKYMTKGEIYDIVFRAFRQKPGILNDSLLKAIPTSIKILWAGHAEAWKILVPRQNGSKDFFANFPKEFLTRENLMKAEEFMEDQKDSILRFATLPILKIFPKEILTRGRLLQQIQGKPLLHQMDWRCVQYLFDQGIAKKDWCKATDQDGNLLFHIIPPPYLPKKFWSRMCFEYRNLKGKAVADHIPELPYHQSKVFAGMPLPEAIIEKMGTRWKQSHAKILNRQRINKRKRGLQKYRERMAAARAGAL
jgi:hypothetical protein